MERPQIIRLWGKADSFDIEFTHTSGTTWKVDVPPDLQDGVYAVQLTALNELSEFATWTGELFMCNGACCIKFEVSPYLMWIKVKEYAVEVSTNLEMIIGKGCSHVRQRN